MLTDLYVCFEKRPEFTRLEQLQLRNLNAVYASAEQVYVVAVYETEREMMERWERAAREAAVKIQSRLTDEHDGLRWEIYLLLLVTRDNVSVGIRKIIENDRQYFRKLLLTLDDMPFERRLPFRLQLDTQADTTGTFLFEETHFLHELKGCLLAPTVQRLGDRFFSLGCKDENDLMHMLFPHRLKNGGKQDETSGN